MANFLEAALPVNREQRRGKTTDDDDEDHEHKTSDCKNYCVVANWNSNGHLELAMADANASANQAAAIKAALLAAEPSRHSSACSCQIALAAIPRTRNDHESSLLRHSAQRIAPFGFNLPESSCEFARNVIASPQRLSFTCLRELRSLSWSGAPTDGARTPTVTAQWLKTSGQQSNHNTATTTVRGNRRALGALVLLS